jgi:hypothetical protein
MARLTADPDGKTIPEPASDNVVNLYDGVKPVPKREKKRLKKEMIEREGRSLVQAYVEERLDTSSPDAELVLTAKGGHKSGGTTGDDIWKDFRHYCKEEQTLTFGKSHFGRFIGEFVERARNSKGVVYGAVIAQPIAKRKAA